MSEPVRLGRFKLLLFSAVTTLAIGAAAYFGAEYSLKASDFGYDASFYRTDRAADPPVYRENDDVTRPFFPEHLVRKPVPFSLPLEKPAGSYRVFVLGASAALGDPEPAFSPARMLEVMFRDAGREVVVVNAGITAVNSHVVAGIAQDVAWLDPDAYIVYLGNNEVVGPFGPGTVFNAFQRSYRGIRFSIRMKRSRVGQWVRSKQEPDVPELESWGGIEMFRQHRVPGDDPRLPRVYDHFRRNLEKIVDAGRAVGAEVLLCTVAANLRDQPPFEGEAARAAYARGVERESAGEVEAARAAFVEARDLDELRVRVDSGLNQVIRDLAAERGDVGLLDVEQRFAEIDPLTGSRLFVQHVHFSFEGAYALAAEWYRQLRGTVGASGEPSTRGRVAQALGYNVHERLRIDLEVLRRLQDPPFSGLPGIERHFQGVRSRIDDAHQQFGDSNLIETLRAEYGRALAERPADFFLLRNAARFDSYARRPDLALERLRALAEQRPEDLEVRYHLGQALLKTGDNEAGRRELLAVAESRPRRFADLYGTLGDLAVDDRKLDEAMDWYRTAIETDPRNADAWLQLMTIHLAAGRVEEATRCAQEAVSIRPKEAATHFMVGVVFARSGRVDEALPYLREAIRLEPENAEFGQVLESVGS
ncbi:hypothetical protein ABI59_22110 [Acidobacteria bacterium Mor1]|nr:hypothetical protein ABI59_22110 [Acidobacteria bacterium Mor1]